MLFPAGSSLPSTKDAAADEEVSADVAEGEAEEAGAGVPLAEDWRPSSVAISFVTDRDTVLCDFSAGVYQPVTEDGPRVGNACPSRVPGSSCRRIGLRTSSARVRCRWSSDRGGGGTVTPTS